MCTPPWVVISSMRVCACIPPFSSRVILKSNRRCSPSTGELDRQTRTVFVGCTWCNNFLHPNRARHSHSTARGVYRKYLDRRRDRKPITIAMVSPRCWPPMCASRDMRVIEYTYISSLMLEQNDRLYFLTGIHVRACLKHPTFLLII